MSARAWIRTLAYPVAVLGGTVAVAAAIACGAPPAIALGALMGANALAVALFERVAPAHAAWRRPREDRQADLLHLLLSTLALGALFQALVIAPLGAWAARACPSALLWPSRWPQGAQLGLALAASELGAYVAHRLLHSVPCFWRVHAVHHAAPRLYWLNATRNHPLDVLFSLALATAPLVLLGAPERITSLLAALAGAHLLWQHANVDLRLGPLGRLFNLGDVHRWHHARDLRRANANYGNVLLMWDWIFGTAAVVHSRPPDDVGLAGGASLPATYGALLAAPFRATWFETEIEKGGPDADELARDTVHEQPGARRDPAPDGGPAPAGAGR